MNFVDVKALLHAIRYLQPLPLSSLHQLLQHQHIIQHDMPRRLQDYHVRTWVINVIMKQYNRSRVFHGLTRVSADMSRQEILSYLGQDYQQGDRVLEAWSVMFVRYSGLLDYVSVPEHERLAQTTERTLRRRQTYGHKLMHLHILLR